MTPDADLPAELGRSPSTSRLLRRGLTRRCPACGQGGLFHRWMTMLERCPRCGLTFERIEGHWIGAIGMNTIVSFGALLVSTIVLLVSTLPDAPVRTLILINVSVAAIVPLLFHPFSRTLWTAIDIAMRPLEAHEVDWTKVTP